MREVIDTLHDEWGVTVIAFTADASGESRKARKMLVQAIPRIIAPDCYAHQVRDNSTPRSHHHSLTSAPRSI
jgi:hypothetical protein